MQIRRRPPNPAIAVEYLRYQIKADDAAPQNILEEIVWHKETEVDRLREAVPLVELRKRLLTAPTVRNFLAALQQSTTQPAVIAEVKKASPSKGVIREDFDPVAIAQAYQQGGATCLSVLTDSKFFQGSFEYLTAIRAATDLPLLCKDFILYPYQMFYARVHGADAVLFIAAILSDQDLSYFIKIARSLNLTALIEVHAQEELDRVLALEGVNLIGINNRDLQDFSVDLQTTCRLLSNQNQQIRDRQILIVSESGLYTSADLNQVSQAGARAVLMGESLIKQPDPGIALSELLRSLNTAPVSPESNS